MADLSLLDLGKLTEPANTLIKKISEAVGGLFRPHQTIRMANADAEAAIIMAQTEIQITDLQRRAMHRFVDEEAKRQENIEAITRTALPLLGDSSAPEGMNDDWITNFFDKSRIVSDAEMQRVWSAVLAGEANGPGSFSRQTVNLLGNMDKSDAELFAALCGFMWGIGEMVPLIFDPSHEIYTKRGIHYESLLHLQSLGLIETNTAFGFFRGMLPKEMRVFHFGSWALLSLPKESENELKIGLVIFTRAGKELARVCESVPAPGHFDFVLNKWASEGILGSGMQHAKPLPTV